MLSATIHWKVNAVKTTILTVPYVQVAVLIFDVWDRHWCGQLQDRINILAPQINAAVVYFRNKGAQIIHAPGDVVNTFYHRHPARLKAMRLVPSGTPPEEIYYPFAIHPEPTHLLFTQEYVRWHQPPRSRRNWTRQHSAIQISYNDWIISSLPEVLAIFRSQKIQLVMVMGVHANICITVRPYGLRALRKIPDVKTVVLRDLVDVLYCENWIQNFTLNEAFTQVIEHIETWLCPTICSRDLIKSPVSG